MATTEAVVPSHNPSLPPAAITASTPYKVTATSIRETIGKCASVRTRALPPDTAKTVKAQLQQLTQAVEAQTDLNKDEREEVLELAGKVDLLVDEASRTSSADQCLPLMFRAQGMILRIEQGAGAR